MSGHVFILHGDLTMIACDAWLMPCDAGIHVMPHWYPDPDWTPPQATPDWRHGARRVMRVQDWPDPTQPWLVNTGGGLRRDVRWFAAGVTQFVDRAAPHARRNRFIRKRSKPLLAFPLVGTGAGGAATRAGDLVNVMLPELSAAARKHDVDVALVVRDEPTYTAAVQARRAFAASNAFWPNELTPELRAHADALAARAIAGQLVLFVGAGVGIGANLPPWRELLQMVARQSGVFDPQGDLQSEFDELGALDQARLMGIRLGQAGDAINSEIHRVLAPHRHASLCHALLAALPVSEAVTTNYDQLLERCAEAAGRPFRVLPYDPTPHCRWILKMHGCLSHPEDIVITRSDFLRYDERRAALRGIVQAMLITKHMLFVGFSLTDDNFLRVIEDVRKATGPNRTVDSRFGTALALGRQPLFEELWSDDVQWVRFGDRKTTKSLQAAARTQEIFLDYLASEAAPTSQHLLDKRYDGVLCDGERELRDHLRSFIARLPPDARSTPAWRVIREMIERLGGGEGS